MGGMTQSDQPKKKRAPLSPLTVIAELLLLGGLGVFGYLVWQPWYSVVVLGQKQQAISENLSEKLAKQDPPEKKTAQGEIPVPVLDKNKHFGILYIPALGKNFANVVAEGVGRPFPLDDWNSGVGHYPQTALPGQSGNFALAAHRNGPLAPFRNVEHLRVGDPIYLETAAGWYTYRFRDQEVVTADTVDVLKPFPYLESTSVNSKGILTMTSCHPKNGAALRIISYAVFDKFTPRSEGPPKYLAKVNTNVGKQQ